MTSQPKAKVKTCKADGCNADFVAFNSLQKVCSVPCARKYAQDTAKATQEKAYRAETRRRRENLKTRSDWLKEAQAAFNRYIRARDYGKPCISCNRIILEKRLGGSIDAGHYRSRGAASHLRFDLFNTHGQCKQCNRDRSGNVVDYRICLVNRIGQDRVERLEQDLPIEYFAPDGQRVTEADAFDTDGVIKDGYKSIRKVVRFDIEYLKRVKAIFNRRANHYERLRGLR